MEIIRNAIDQLQSWAFIKMDWNCVLTTAGAGADANATSADGATFKITNVKFMFLLLLYQQNKM